MTEFFILLFHLQKNTYYQTYICISESNKAYFVSTNVKNIKDITYYLNDFIYNKSDGYYGYGSNNNIWVSRLDRTYG